MRTKFERILKLMQDYVDFSVNTRAEINKINADMNISQKRKGELTNELKGKLLAFCEKCMNETDNVIGKIIAEAGERNNNCNLDSLGGVFAYISASGSASDNDVVMNALKPHIGIIPELKAIYTACENNGVNEVIKATIRGYLYNLDDIESTMKEACTMTFCGTASATSCGKKIERQAKLLGIDIVSNVRDEFSDEQMLRRVAGLI